MRTRRRFSAEFKAKVALGAIKGHETVAESNRSRSWPRCSMRRLARASRNRAAELTRRHAKIGQLVVERDFLSKAFDR
jgi:transposase